LSEQVQPQIENPEAEAAVEEEVAPPRSIKRSLTELQDELPIGVQTGGKLDKTYKLREHTLGTDLAMAKWVELNPDAGAAAKVTAYLSNVVAIVGNMTFKGDAPEDRLTIGQLHFGDVVFLLLRAAYLEMGGTLVLPRKCPHCGDWNAFKPDLATVEVQCVADPAGLHDKVTLSRPLIMDKGRVLARSLKLRSPRWIAMEMIHGGNKSTQVGDVTLGMMFDAIHGTEHGRAPVQSELLAMRKRDVNVVSDAIENLMFGPLMRAEATCPHCKKLARVAIPWDYDSFFEVRLRLQDLKT